MKRSTPQSALLNKTKKEMITLLQLKNLTKSKAITANDAIEIIKELYKNNLCRFNKLCVLEYLTASTFAKAFDCDYAKATKIMRLLLNQKAIAKHKIGYKICNLKAYKSVGALVFGGEHV